MHSPTAEPGSAPSPIPAAMQGGGVLARVLAVGWRIAPRVWPFAALICLPELVVYLRLQPQRPAWPPVWPYLPLHFAVALGQGLVAAALMPSVMRWFADERERVALQRGDSRGRAAAAMGAAVVGASIHLVISTPLLFVGDPHSALPSRWPFVAMLVVEPIWIWIELRLVILMTVASIERCGPLAAVRRSWRLTRGWALRCLGVGVVLVLFWIAAYVVVRLVSRGDSKHDLVWLSPGLAAALMPWFFALQAVIYHDARCAADDVSSRRIAEDAAPL
ncbi:MAG TPA: hypothetical protein VFY71_02200 [Planctomycetota bacterium]|nr:hypothetical protein [Planctomycetota bacterium]